MPDTQNLLKNCLGLFELNRIDRDIYTWTGKNVGWARIFGGQVMAQTLVAAYKTVKADHFAHSFHSYFLRPGQMDKPITFTVDRIINSQFSIPTYLCVYKAQATIGLRRPPI